MALPALPSRCEHRSPTLAQRTFSCPALPCPPDGGGGQHAGPEPGGAAPVQRAVPTDCGAGGEAPAGAPDDRRRHGGRGSGAAAARTCRTIPPLQAGMLLRLAHTPPAIPHPSHTKPHQTTPHHTTPHHLPQPHPFTTTHTAPPSRPSAAATPRCRGGGCPRCSASCPPSTPPSQPTSAPWGAPGTWYCTRRRTRTLSTTRSRSGVYRCPADMVLVWYRAVELLVWYRAVELLVWHRCTAVLLECVRACPSAAVSLSRAAAGWPRSAPCRAAQPATWPHSPHTPTHLPASPALPLPQCLPPRVKFQTARSCRRWTPTTRAAASARCPPSCTSSRCRWAGLCVCVCVCKPAPAPARRCRPAGA